MAAAAAAIVVVGALQPAGVVATAGTDDWILLSFAGIITAVPLLLFARAALRLPLTVLGPLQYLVPTINFLLGWLVYDEPLDRVRVVGFVLVWIALFITIGDSIRARRNTIAVPSPPAPSRSALSNTADVVKPAGVESSVTRSDQATSSSSL
jgi:chloramphenicol-sensitive protein RarD